MATIVDVAKHCGVSTATVSMVLRDKGRISDRTRQRVLQAVDELGYVYNQTAANLRNQHSNQIGLLLNDITNPFYSEMTAGLSQEMEDNDLMLFLANSEDAVERQKKFIESLLSQKAGGLVLCPAKGTDQQFLATLKRRQLPVILAVRDIEGTDYDYVGTDNFYGGQLVTQHLLDLGHRHIAFIGGEKISKNRASRMGGYMSKLIEYNISPQLGWMVTCPATRNGGAAAMETLLKHHPEVTAVVCYQDIVAFGAIRTLRQHHLEPGKDVAITGFDDVPEAADTYPALTTISVSAREIGRRAGEALLDRIRGNTEPQKRIIIPPKLVIRQSCGTTDLDSENR